MSSTKSKRVLQAPREHTTKRPCTDGDTMSKSPSSHPDLDDPLISDAENVSQPPPPRRSDRDRCDVSRFVAAPAGDAPIGKATPRFHFVPRQPGWHDLVRKMRCAARNTLPFKLKPLPRPPGGSCWLIPCDDKRGVEIAQLAPQLRALGWKVLTSEAHVVELLGCKAGLRVHAERHGLLQHLPRYFQGPEEAQFPCVLKASAGVYGKDCFICHCKEDILKVTDTGFGSKWVLQEFQKGCFEYSTSLLVRDGNIVDAVCTRYQYDSDEYVWPRVNEIWQNRAFPEPPAEHMAAMTAFLSAPQFEFSGICNFNYKIRDDGSICIFEINTRVGADFACDIPRPRARMMLEKLEAMFR
ncbi:hypothetical protein AB1Y20_015400 [Prymnesium parvum]|uniref:ATP-grasp domain-containing protein n=1 Tax=Prymnesium parvum TaxID=97485 RepID=A0AB34JYD7_PRYPA